MNAKRFAGACIVVGGALLPFAPWYTVLGGVALAAAATWAMERRRDRSVTKTR